MSKIKLEIGKTYRNLRGEDVKIIEKIIDGIHSYKGDNGHLYTESGRFLFYAEESLLDIIKEVEKERE